MGWGRNLMAPALLFYILHQMARMLRILKEPRTHRWPRMLMILVMLAEARESGTLRKGSRSTPKRKWGRQGWVRDLAAPAFLFYILRRMAQGANIISHVKNQGQQGRSARKRIKSILNFVLIFQLSMVAHPP